MGNDRSNDIIWLYVATYGNVMVMDKSRISVVEESDIGLYVWELPNGMYLADDDGNLLNIPSRLGDISRMRKIAEVARNLGYGEGTPTFAPGVRRVSDSEHQEQIYRMMNGEIPDEYDMGALRDDLRNR